MVRQPDGSFIEIDNRKGLSRIDETRREVVEYAQNNLAKEDYDEVVEASLDFFSDVKTIRQKSFYKTYEIFSCFIRLSSDIHDHVSRSSKPGRTT